MLVPSGSVINDQLGPDTKARCDRAIAIWKKEIYTFVIVTGGIYEDIGIQSIPASTIMKNYMVSKGIPKECILEEPDSLDTFQNIDFSLEKIKRLRLKKFAITVVTQYQHAIRFFITFLLGHKMLIRIRLARYKISFNTWCKEWFFILYHLYDWKGNKKLAQINRASRSRN